MAVKTTQRAYTLRLTGTDRNDQTWRENLWRTHEAVNKGAKAFGDWLLTLRGGLDHKLADMPVVDGKGDKKTERAPTEAERRNRRIVLALSWLSVESADGALNRLVIAAGNEPNPDRRRKVLAAFGAILQGRGIKPAAADSWVEDCRNSLTAAIRDDAAWVDRSAAFDAVAKSVGKSLTRAEVWDMLGPFFVDAASYLQPAATELDDAQPKSKEKAKDLVQKAGQWLSSRFGTGTGADFDRMASVYQKIADWADGKRSGRATIAGLAGELQRDFKVDETDPVDGLDYVIRLSSYPGHSPNPVHELLSQGGTLTEASLEDLAKKATKRAESCASKSGAKGHRAYSDAVLSAVEAACGFTYLVDSDGRDVGIADYPQYDDGYDWGPSRHFEFSVMLDHAARRVSVAHSWQKLAEAERRQFVEDAAKRAPVDVVKWLDGFLSERGRLSAAIGPMQIRRRAVVGWKDVVKAWSARDCKTAADRVQAARALQDELDKFGDITLFEALAGDDAKAVRMRDSKHDPQPLLDYVYARDAEFKMRRFKVPAYRHPDALSHPVFCDFGKSRWSVSFTVHDAAMGLSKADAELVEREAEVAAAKTALERTRVEARLLRAKKQRDAAASGFADARSGRGIELKLWGGKDFKLAGLAWQSKRLASDLALEQDDNGGTGVSRADRAGRAAVGVEGDSPVRILNVFDENDWAARLQAPRAQLDRLAIRVAKRGWDSKARRMRDCLKWLVTFSARLQEQDNGPWPAYVERLVQAGRADAFSRKDAKGVYCFTSWPHSEANKSRGGLARFDLCRLPALRVLSVDLGHRHAAACAVWETLTEKEAARLCHDVDHKPPRPDDIALHLVGKRNGKKVKAILRRTGPDTWARLDRQFTIKLQGEHKVQFSKTDPKSGKPMRDAVRRASEDESAWVKQLQAWLGYNPRPDEDPRPDVVDLMSQIVRLARLGMRRHGDRARIAFYLDPKYKPERGGKTALSEEGRRELLEDALVLWQGLFSGPRWQDARAREAWQQHVRAKLPPAPVEGASRAELKAYDKKVRELLPDYAAKLATDATLREKLHRLWSARWHEDDGEFGVTAEVNKSRKLAGFAPLPLREATGWYRQLRNLTDWILPRGNPKSDSSIRHVGGLSLDRLSSIRELYQLLKAHRTRPEPEDVRANVPDKGNASLDKYGQRILNTLERMRENRVKQLASRIVEAALGIGKESADGGPRPTSRVYEPCHAVVVENLEFYRPEQTRTRRENRQLMRWSAAKVLKYLKESCDLNGLYLRQVMPNYTSRQDSRTGAPGIRCTDMPVEEFLRRFKGRVDELRKKGDAESAYIVALWDRWNDRDGVGMTVRIPQDGGEIFVSAEKQSPAAKGLQADLNAAANIGLRALLDPDWPGKWWWIPCEGKSSKPAKDKVKGSSALDASTSLVPEWKPDSKEVVNLWRDVSAKPIEPGDWKGYSEYWNGVKSRVIANLRRQAGL